MENEESWDFDIFSLEAATMKRFTFSYLHLLMKDIDLVLTFTCDRICNVIYPSFNSLLDSQVPEYRNTPVCAGKWFAPAFM